MNMVIPNEGKILWLNAALKLEMAGPFESWVVDLFTNNVLVSDSSTAAGFTLATFTGYAQVSVLRSQFAYPTITSNVAYTQRSSAPSFTCTGGSAQTCYGWIMRGATSGTIWAGQNFDVARIMSSGVTETLNPFKFGLKTLV